MMRYLRFDSTEKPKPQPQKPPKPPQIRPNPSIQGTSKKSYDSDTIEKRQD